MIYYLHRTCPVGADDPGGPYGSAYKRRAEVVAPYIGFYTVIASCDDSVFLLTNNRITRIIQLNRVT